MIRTLFFTISICLLTIFNTQSKAQSWDEIIKAVASDRAADDLFGYSVSISGDYAIVGAHHNDTDASGSNTLTSAGAAYIFNRDGSGNWNWVQKIVASDRATDNEFGKTVGISGDYAIVGAMLNDMDASGGNTLTNSGASYIFEKGESGNWLEKQKIVASDRTADSYFGHSVSISGDYVIVGAVRNDTDASGENTLDNAGAAYIFLQISYSDSLC